MSTTKQVLRSAKNVMRGYSSVQVLVRDATSNDNRPTNIYELEDIASHTYDTVDFYEIMDMLDKRLNDKGKYWKHIVKSLTVLDYLVRFGSENCVMWCKENLYAIKTLREFRYLDDSGIDQGHIVRVKARELCALVEDDERLREERRFNRGRRRPGSSNRGTPSSQYRRQDYTYSATTSEGREPIPPPYVPSSSNSTAANSRTDIRNEGGEEEMDEDLRRAIEESKITAEEDEKRRKQLAQYDEEDPELQAALQLSKEEEELKQLQELQRLQREYAQMQSIQQAQAQAYMQGQGREATEGPYFDIFGNPISAEEWAGYQRQQQQWEQQQAQQQQAQEQYVAQQRALVEQNQMQGLPPPPPPQQQVLQDQYGQETQSMYGQNQYNQDQYGQNQYTQNQYPQNNYMQNQYNQGQYVQDQYGQSVGQPVGQPVGQQMGQQQQQQPDYMQQPVPTGSNNPFSLENIGKPISAGVMNDSNNNNNINSGNMIGMNNNMNNQFGANQGFNQQQQQQMTQQMQQGQIQDQNQFHNQYQVPQQMPPPVQQQQQQQHLPQPQQQQPLQQMRTGNSAISNKYSELNQLIGEGPDIDTFGNTGIQRIPAQHTKTGTFINSQGTGYKQVADDPKGNPFHADSYPGLPSASMVPAQTGYGFGNQGGIQQSSNQPMQHQQQQYQNQNQPQFQNQQQHPDQGVSLIDL